MVFIEIKRLSKIHKLLSNHIFFVRNLNAQKQFKITKFTKHIEMKIYCCYSISWFLLTFILRIIL